MFKIKILHFKDTKNVFALAQGYAPLKQILIKIGMNIPHAGALPKVHY